MLALCHPADAAGLAFWTAQLAAAQGSPAAIGAMILNIISGATGTDNTVVTNRVAVATDFTAQATNEGLPWTEAWAAQSATELNTVDATAASVTAAIAATTTFFANQFETFTLTQNVDTFTTSEAGVIFNAPPVVTALGIAVTDQFT